MVPPAGSFVDWVRALIARRDGSEGARDATRIAAIRAAISQVLDSGTVLVGDISNSLAPVPHMAAAGLGGAVFHELLGFRVVDAGPVVADARKRLADALAGAAEHSGLLRGAVVAHAPYSVSPALFRHIAGCERDTGLSVHLGESPEELEFLRAGSGPMRSLLGDLGAWDGQWDAPGTGPVSYLASTGYLQPGMLAVHGVHLTQSELETLAARRAVIVTCPRSNVWVGAGMPNVSRFYAAGVPVAIGTDSLASVASLNLFDELAELRRIAPDVAASSFIDSATRVGAEALGFGATHGTLARGKRAALVAVDVPASVTDVEEYLVSGVPRAAVRRVQ
jgi:cytosine/adenosine deaminase-related metal-dependent hydrolase